MEYGANFFISEYGLRIVNSANVCVIWDVLFLWFAEYISQVGSSGDGSMIIIRDCHYTSAEAAGTGLKVQIFADIKEDTELDDYAEEFTYGLADAIEQIEGRILL
jgi:hypothetical protein